MRYAVINQNRGQNAEQKKTREKRCEEKNLLPEDLDFWNENG